MIIDKEDAQYLKIETEKQKIIDKFLQIYIPAEHILAIDEVINPSFYFPSVNGGYIGQIMKIGDVCQEQLLTKICILPNIYTVCLNEGTEDTFYTLIRGYICPIKHIAGLMDPINIQRR